MSVRRDTRTWYLERTADEVVSPSLLGFATSRAGRSVLDVGSGPGGYARRLSATGRCVFALDNAESYLAQARSDDVSAVRAFADALPFADSTVDTVILFEVLEHLAAPREALVEGARVARHNILITVPDNSRQPDLAALGLSFEHMLDDDHKNFFTRESLWQLAQNAGLEAAITPGDFVDTNMIRLALGQRAARLAGLLVRMRIYRPRLSLRLFAEISLDGQ